MQAITTKYLGPSVTRGARIKATCSGGGLSVTIPRDFARDLNIDHAAACRALCQRLGWTGRLVGGHTKGGMVWVFKGGMEVRV